MSTEAPQGPEILRYRSVLTLNREVFLLKFPFTILDFDRIDENFPILAKPLHTVRDTGGKSHVSLVPFFLLMQRQARAAFLALSTFQSYEGWLVLRPAIEAALICGKWVDDPKSAEIWAQRREKPKAYRREYQGTALQSRALPHSAQIQSVLSTINDNFVHANPDYYDRHLNVARLSDTHVGIAVGYFDDEPHAEASVYSLFQLLLIIQGALRDMLSPLFPALADLDLGHAGFATEYEPRASKLVAEHPEVAPILRDLGLWRPRPAA